MLRARPSTYRVSSSRNLQTQQQNNAKTNQAERPTWLVSEAKLNGHRELGTHQHQLTCHVDFLLSGPAPRPIGFRVQLHAASFAFLSGSPPDFSVDVFKTSSNFVVFTKVPECGTGRPRPHFRRVPEAAKEVVELRHDLRLRCLSKTAKGAGPQHHLHLHGATAIKRTVDI